jgi:hypothetical protein
MMLGIDVCQILSVLLTPNNPILLTFLAVGVGFFLAPDDEQ